MRFLFCSLDSLGFLFPSIGVARALAARGHEVAFATDARLAELLAGLGLSRIPRGPTDGGSFQVPHWPDPIAIAIQVKHLEYAIERFAPDVLIGQALTMGPLIVAERQRIPVGILGFCAYLWPTDEGPGDDSLEQRRLRWRYRDMMSVFNRARACFRLPPSEAGCRGTPLLGDLYMVRSVPELGPDPADLPARVHLVGSCLWDPPDEDDPELTEWLAEARRAGAQVLYVHHGKFFEANAFWIPLVEALAGMDVRVGASVGQMRRPLGEVPGHYLVRFHLSQAPVLRQARLLVAGGNSTAFLGAMEAGVPALLIPAGGEHPEVAELARRAGVARILEPEEATPERLRANVEALLTDPGYAERAAACRAAFAEVDGLERAADLLERLAVERGPGLREPASAEPALAALPGSPVEAGRAAGAGWERRSTPLNA
jgi:UDP:flavonoid glycosyltransferase YjiC (YdhE family)